MANTFAVCLLLSLFCCTNLSSARHVPKECSKGPGYWCQSLKRAADCGAVGHCIATVWENQNKEISSNEISDKFVKLFRELKDVKDMINADYLGTRMKSSCSDIGYPAATRFCKENTAGMEDYLSHVLISKVTPESMCRIVGMCNNMQLDKIIDLSKKNVPESHHDAPKEELLGSKRCTWGPAYWCSNFSTSHECKANRHCVQVWSKISFPEDKDDICKICTDMVKQARDQLQSNETQEELKEVFEGSCNLIPVKIVRKECIKLADDFVPELVETLASEMNPQQVCSVAGLCNNEKIDALLEGYNTNLKLREGCTTCHKTVAVMRKKFDATSYDDFLVGLLQVCGKMSSLSDSCSMLVFKYYENLVAAVKHDLTPQSICHLSGQCAYKFHTHADYVFPEERLDDLKATDDVPCEFCEKLVVHLRDVLIANTTEMQFQKILNGLCKQTSSFKAECLHLVEQYYPLIYNYLVSDMKPDQICAMMGICGKPKDVPIAPLLPKELAIKAITPNPRLIGAEEAKIARIPVMKQANVRIMGTETTSVPPPQLPLERMFVAMPQSKVACSFCEYLLHYLQVELSDTKNEEKVKEAVEKACDRLPQSVSGECRQFITEYGPAVIALLVQEIDPASVCPALRVCPQTQEVRRVSINSEKSNCPLCLFAVEQLETMLKNNRSEESIRQALDGLCTHLSQKLRTECVDFVDTYSTQLVEMLVANMNAQEICVFLKLCTDETADPLKITHPSIDKYFENPMLRADRNNMKKTLYTPERVEDSENPMLSTDKNDMRKATLVPKRVEAGDIETNEIPDNTVNGRPVMPIQGQKTVCVMCEFVMKEIDDEIKDKHNEDEIKQIVHGVCKRMPKSVRAECDQFVEKYADLVISLLAQELNPDEVCKQLKLCDPGVELEIMRKEILDCAVCETVVMAVKKVLTNDKVDRNIVHIVEKSCGLLPAKYSTRCHTMMEIYGDSVIHLIQEYGSKAVCQKIGLCSSRDKAYVNMYREHKMRD